MLSGSCSGQSDILLMQPLLRDTKRLVADFCPVQCLADAGIIP